MNASTGATAAVAAAMTTTVTSVDPWTQTMSWIQVLGTSQTTVPVPMEDLAEFTFQNIRLGLVYGAQVGLASLMLVTLLLLTRSDKRGSPIYMLNTLALFLDVLRGSMMAAWLDSTWNHPLVAFESDYSHITAGDKTKSLMADVFKVAELGVILSSLILQVCVMMATAPSHQRALVVGVACALALVTMCELLASTVVNAQNIVYLAPVASYALQYRLSDVASILQLVSAGFFLAIFVAKLAVAIRRRRRIGQRKFGPMQVVFIGSLQSMIIPVIFTAAQWNQYVDLGSLSMTMLAIQLPLTALWASTSIEARMDGEKPERAQKQPSEMLGSDRHLIGGQPTRKLDEDDLSTSTTSSELPSPMRNVGTAGTLCTLCEAAGAKNGRNVNLDVKTLERHIV
ncbi:uncharacterized protein PV09_08169 [Verruconis gallopava]|uniref:Pheromone alpha factor receptor n=1 Tax=Verruconis gallopava TaxID=253628 RepID=A0A0D2AMB2_9PEZI|nr:uncharacterized protein PV09_08169 [Verruconis gallopava]KIW00279.1 hypothetical protein PV09_08169 [Verruconis gallopava]